MNELCRVDKENPLLASIDCGLRFAHLDSTSLALILVEINDFESFRWRYQQHLDDCVKLVHASIKRSLDSCGNFHVTCFAEGMFAGVLPGVSPGTALTVAEDIVKNLIGITIPYRHCPTSHKMKFFIGVGLVQEVGHECASEWVYALAEKAVNVARKVYSPQIVIS